MSTFFPSALHNHAYSLFPTSIAFDTRFATETRSHFGFHSLHYCVRSSGRNVPISRSRSQSGAAILVCGERWKMWVKKIRILVSKCMWHYCIASVFMQSLCNSNHLIAFCGDNLFLPPNENLSRSNSENAWRSWLNFKI